jgi:hypothetical protein
MTEFLHALGGLLQLCTGLLAVPTLAGYVCRLGALSLKRHAWQIAVMHAALFAAVLGSFMRALNGQAGPVELAAVCGAALWLAVSIDTWRTQVPTHYLRR